MIKTIQTFWNTTQNILWERTKVIAKQLFFKRTESISLNQRLNSHKILKETHRIFQWVLRVQYTIITENPEKAFLHDARWLSDDFFFVNLFYSWAEYLKKNRNLRKILTGTPNPTQKREHVGGSRTVAIFF